MVQQDAHTWSTWKALGAPTAGFLSHPQALRLTDGRLAVAALGGDGQAYLATDCATGCPWTGFAPVTQQTQLSLLRGTPLLIQLPTGSVKIVTAGLDGKLYSTIPGGKWTAFASLPTGQTLVGDLALTQDTHVSLA